MLVLKKDVDKDIANNEVSSTDYYTIRKKHINYLLKNLIFLLEYNDKKDNALLAKEKEKLLKEINDINQLKNSGDQQYLDYSTSYELRLIECNKKLKIINDIEKDFGQQEEYIRVIYNKDSYHELIELFKLLISDNSYSIKKENMDSLKCHSLLTFVNLYFEDIYKDIDSILAINYDNKSDVEIDDMVDNECNKLSTKYGNKNDLITCVMNKYFTDRSMVNMNSNIPPRSIFAKMRRHYPHNISNPIFTTLRNMSHGNYNFDGTTINKDSFSISIDDLDSFVKTNLYSNNSKYSCCIDLIEFLNSLNKDSDINNIKHDDMLKYIIKLSSFSIIQYNNEHYFNQLKDENNKMSIESLKARDIFEVSQGGNAITNISVFDIFEYIKNSVGHGNIDINGNEIIFINKKTDTYVKCDLYDYLEFIFQFEILKILTYSSTYSIYMERCKAAGLRPSFPFSEIPADTGIKAYTEKDIVSWMR